MSKHFIKGSIQLKVVQMVQCNAESVFNKDRCH